jgi:HAD superfamily hydrolase (TIGR01484 family)
LGDALASLDDVDQHIFELTEKDGYLATNSLLMDATLVARAYGRLDGSHDTLPSTMEGLRLDDMSIPDWVERSAEFARAAVERRGLIVLYAPSLRPIAGDLESKLAEAALSFVQVADLRSFAHGRHLWLAERPDDCAVLVLTDQKLSELWSYMRSQIPSGVPCLELRVAENSPKDLISALIAELHFVGMVAKHSQKDPGRPIVPDFGRNLYYADLSGLVDRPAKPEDGGIAEKFEILGARWPYAVHKGSMRRARDAYCQALEKQRFRAIVFDYDGTLCSSQQRDKPPTKEIIDQIVRLTQAQVYFAIVSGRGGSMHEELRAAVPKSEWPRIQLGLYNGGLLTDLGSEISDQDVTSEFLNHVSRIVHHLKDIGVPIDRTRATPPFQVSIRFREGVDTEAMWFVVADALRRAGLDLGAIVRSRNSIDVLEPATSKARLIAQLIQQNRLLPQELLTIGDQGAWPGNDSALLEHRFSLSVDFSSRRLDRGWKLAPPHKRGVDAAQWYLERITTDGSGHFQIVLHDPQKPIRHLGL